MIAEVPTAREELKSDALLKVSHDKYDSDYVLRLHSLKTCHRMTKWNM